MHRKARSATGGLSELDEGHRRRTGGSAPILKQDSSHAWNIEPVTYDSGVVRPPQTPLPAGKCRRLLYQIRLACALLS
jgi:hypothetical protein